MPALSLTPLPTQRDLDRRGWALACFLGAGFFLESSLVISRRGGGSFPEIVCLSLQVSGLDPSGPFPLCSPYSGFLLFQCFPLTSCSPLPQGPLTLVTPFINVPTLPQCPTAALNAIATAH